jgi:hypothetical protein
MTTTLSNSEVGTSDLQDTPAERETLPGGPIGRKSAVTRSDVRAKLHTYFTPPSVLTARPSSVRELRVYAHGAGWTADVGLLRSLGIGYFRLIGRPATVVCRYVEWIAQRPGRALPVFAAWKLFILVGPGPWVADYLIRPAGVLAGWIFL